MQIDKETITLITLLPITSFDALCVCVCVCVVSVIVKRPVLPPCVVDGRSRNPLYYYYYVTFSGTIGIVMSSLVDRVIGLDVVDQAIQDAEFNAHLNGN